MDVFAFAMFVQLQESWGQIATIIVFSICVAVMALAATIAMLVDPADPNLDGPTEDFDLTDALYSGAPKVFQKINKSWGGATAHPRPHHIGYRFVETYF